MTPEDLQKLIAAGETMNVEFKSEKHNPLKDRELIDTVVCLSNRPNSEPAWLLVGVEDDGRITGIGTHRVAGITDPARIAALVSNRTRPSLMVRIHLVPIQGREVLALEVPQSRTPVGTSDGYYLRRAIGGDGKPACLPMQFHEMQSLQAGRGLLDYSALPVPEAGWKDLDPLELERYRRSLREHRGRSNGALLDLPDQELARVLGAVNGNGLITVLGLLIFGKEEALDRFLPVHEVAFQVLRGQEVEVNDFFRWPLLRIMEEIDARFRARNREQELMVGMFRVGVPDYPAAAFREALANALIHRDYSRLGAVNVQWYDDHVEISNPGGFPEGVRLDNLLVTPPRPRNPLLADAFKRAGIVERTARGIDTIFYEQLRNGRPSPSYERSDDLNVILVLPGGKANLEFVRMVVEESQAGRILRLDELLLLNALWQERTMTTDEAAHLIQKPEPDARRVLNSLIEAGMVEARGEKKGRDWHLSAATYRRLGKKAAYIRQRGFEPLQQEQMIMQYVEKHGRIMRHEAAELCRLSPDQAYRLLTRLTKETKLRHHGTKKGSWYERRG